MKYVYAISLFLFGLLFSFGNAPVTIAQTPLECEFGDDSWTDDVRFIPTGQQPDFNSSNPLVVSLEARFEGECEGKKFIYQIEENGTDTILEKNLTIPSDYAIYKAGFRAGTTECENTAGDDCAISVSARIEDASSNILDDYTTNDLEYEIATGQEDQYPWSLLNEEWSVNSEILPCSVSPTEMKLVDTDTGTRTTLTPGYQGSSFFSDEDPPVVEVTLRIRDCQRTSGQVFGPLENPNNSNDVSKVSEFLTKNDASANTNDQLVTVVYTLGEELCDEEGLNRCNILFATTAQRRFFRAQEWLFGIVNEEELGALPAYWNALLNHGGYISYECDGECDTEWGRKSVVDSSRCLNEDCTETEPVEIPENPFLAGYLNSIQNSPCYIPPQENDPTDIGSIKPDCYDLLAPLPGLVALGVPDNTTTQDGIQEGAFTTQFSLGQWVNRILMFLIGLTGLLAVVMIVIAGAQYMTSEAIGKKTDAKDRIVQSLIGLVLSLGIFVLLNTINPTLLDIDPEIEQVTFEYDDTTELKPIVDANGNRTYDYSQCRGGAPDTTVGCADCVGFDFSEFPTTLGDPANRTISAGYKTKLTNFKNAIINYNASAPVDIEAVITEAYPPTTMRHCSQCHYSGTCTDIALRLNGSRVGSTDIQIIAPLVENFVSLAQQSGLRAEYEIKSGARCNTLKSLMPASLPSTAVKCVNHITGEHFSVYNN